MIVFDGVSHFNCKFKIIVTVTKWLTTKKNWNQMNYQWMSSTVQVFVKLIDIDLVFSHFPFLITERGSKNYYAFVLQKTTSLYDSQLSTARRLLRTDTC